MSTLSDAQLCGLLGFVGYGNPHARLRFMGAEEGLGGAMNQEEKSKNLLARCGWKPVEDLFEAHLMLHERGQRIDISRPRKGSTICWRFMARIARAAEGFADFADREKAGDYMRQHLGRKDGSTFLTELSPIPARRSAQPEQLAQFGDRGRIEELLGHRRRAQLEILGGTAGITICFGLGKGEQFAERFGITWQPMTAPFARSEDGLTFLVPYLGNGQMSEARITAFVGSGEFQEALRRTNKNAERNPSLPCTPTSPKLNAVGEPAI